MKKVENTERPIDYAPPIVTPALDYTFHSRIPIVSYQNFSKNRNASNIQFIDTLHFLVIFAVLVHE